MRELPAQERREINYENYQNSRNRCYRSQRTQLGCMCQQKGNDDNQHRRIHDRYVQVNRYQLISPRRSLDWDCLGLFLAKC